MTGAQPLVIREAAPGDEDAIWGIVGPVIRAGETYALERDMRRVDALAYWLGEDRRSFVALADGEILGTYYIKANHAGGGRHVCNCGYMTAEAASGQGVARAMYAHSLEMAREGGFAAMQFNFVVSTNTRAVRLWERLGFAVVGRLPGAFDHPTHGRVDALVMFRTL